MTMKSTDDDPPRDPSMLRSSSSRVETVGPLVEEALDTKKAPAPPEGPNEAPGEEAQNPASAKKKKKPEINPKFKDVQETGKWGTISKREIVIATAIAVLVITGVVIGVVFGLNGNNGDATPVRLTKAPTMSPTSIGLQQQLVYALNAIDYSDLTYAYQQDLPLLAEDYEGLMQDPTASPQQRAMSWLLYEDERNISGEMGERWALASLYYGWAGDNWVSAENWLSSEDACDWEHIKCDLLTGDIQELVLESNNLVGTIPSEIALLNTTQSIWLRNNQLTGPLPNEVFGSMPHLSILYLDNNQLTGTISLSIRDNEMLSKFLETRSDLMLTTDSQHSFRFFF